MSIEDKEAPSDVSIKLFPHTRNENHVEEGMLDNVTLLAENADVPNLVTNDVQHSLTTETSDFQNESSNFDLNSHGIEARTSKCTLPLTMSNAVVSSNFYDRSVVTDHFCVESDSTTNDIDHLGINAESNDAGDNATITELQRVEESDSLTYKTGENIDQIVSATAQNEDKVSDSFDVNDKTIDKLSSSKLRNQGSTEEEEEWLSMGLGLADALKQIVALTDERDAALSLCHEKQEQSKIVPNREALLEKVQTRLQEEMSQWAGDNLEIQDLHKKLRSYEEQLKKYETMEDELEKAQASLVMLISEKSKLEIEIEKLRDFKVQAEQKEALLSNRLNDAKKKEASKSTTAGRLEADNEKLKEQLQQTTAELDNITKVKAKLENNMEKLKSKAIERVKQAETALSEERELNEERKRKMKIFVESKAEELREAKESASNMQTELQETRLSLSSSRERVEALQKELEVSCIKSRELLRDIERMKRNQEEMYKMGSNLEHELEKSASETEEHKKKRISAKHELMTVVRSLDLEKSVNAKLRESIKFTFTPKALSQQQLLSDCLRDFDVELQRLATKMGKILTKSPHSIDHGTDNAVSDNGVASRIDNGSEKKTKKIYNTKGGTDTERLISNLECETQHVSTGIMSFANSIEQMRILLNEDQAFNCMDYFSHIFTSSSKLGGVRHHKLSNSGQGEEREETVSITSFHQGSSSLL